MICCCSKKRPGIPGPLCFQHTATRLVVLFLLVVFLFRWRLLVLFRLVFLRLGLLRLHALWLGLRPGLLLLRPRCRFCRSGRRGALDRARLFLLRLRPERLSLWLRPVHVMPFLLHRVGLRLELVTLVFRLLGGRMWSWRRLRLRLELRLRLRMRLLRLRLRLWLGVLLLWLRRLRLWLWMLRLCRHRLRTRLRVRQGRRHFGAHGLRRRQCDRCAARYESRNRLGRCGLGSHGLDHRAHSCGQMRLGRH